MPSQIDEKGQTLVIVTFLMIIALTIGISVSGSYFKNLKSQSQTNSATRATAVAEAAIERLLLQPQATLQNYIQFNNCGANCTLTINGTDGIPANAAVTLSYIGNSSANYKVDLIKNETTEVNMAAYPNTTNFSICWDSPTSGPLPSITALFMYGSTGSYSVDNYAYNSIGSVNSSNGFSTATAGSGYANCFSITGKTNPNAVRLRPLYANITVYVVPAINQSIPIQGILISSKGTVSGVTKRVQVIKNFASTPTVFDYVLYQKSPTSALSN